MHSFPCPFCCVECKIMALGASSIHVEVADQEKHVHDEHVKGVTAALDPHGFALVPTPSHFRDDPLVRSLSICGSLSIRYDCPDRPDRPDLQNWPSWLKWLVLLQASVMALLGPFNSAAINPALLPLANSFHISKVEASWQTTTSILAAGVAPLFWTPLANIYGRRPIYLVSTLIGIGATIGTALSTSWAGMLVARVFSGAATSAPMALGAAVVSDMFFLHEVGLRAVDDW